MASNAINIVYFGTNTFSAKVLHSLLQHTNILVKYIVTKSDKKVGRGRSLTPNPLTVVANKYRIPVIRVSSLIKNPNQLTKINFNTIDLGVVVSFAYILPYDILCQIKKGFINLHPSLLPIARGPSPIQYSIINCGTNLGISTMLLDRGVDSGPLLLQQKININSSLVYPQIEEIIVREGEKLLYKTIIRYNLGLLKPKKQNENNATFCNFIKKEDGFVTLSENSTHLYNLYRAYYTWPGIFTTVAHLEDFLGFKLKVRDKQAIIKLKQVVLDEKGNLLIHKLQLPNKPVIEFKDFVNGYKL